MPRSPMKPKPDFADDWQSRRDEDREGHGPPPPLSILRRCQCLPLRRSTMSLLLPSLPFPSLIGTVTASKSAAKTTVETEMEVPLSPSRNPRLHRVRIHRNRRQRSRPPSPRLGWAVNPIGKMDTGTVQINATTNSLWMAEISMATAKVDNVTGLVWDVYDIWYTAAHTGGEILPIKDDEEVGKSKDDIIWDVDEAWVSISLTGEETLPIQDKE